MADILRMDEQELNCFSDWLAPSGLSTKDFIAPSSFEFKTGRAVSYGQKTGRGQLRADFGTRAE